MKRRGYLYNNIIDKNLQDFLRPFDLIYPIFFQSKHKIHNNFITPIGNSYKMLSVVGNIVYIAALTSSVNFFRLWNPSIQSVYPYLRIIMASLINVILFVSNILHANLNVNLILNIQSARSVVRCRNNELKKLIICNWCKVTTLILVLTTYIVYPVIYLGWQFPLVINHLVLIFYDFVIVHEISMVTLLRNSIDLWLAEIRKRKKKIFLKKQCYLSKKLLLLRVYWREMQNAFLDLQKAYLTYLVIFSLPTILYVCGSFFESLIFLQIFITFEKSKNFINTQSNNAVQMLKMSELMLTLRMTKNYFFICRLCHEFQKLYSSVLSVRTECLTEIGKGIVIKEQREVYKNVLRATMEFPKFSPYSVFEVDAAMPRLFAGLVSTYFIVLIQYAIL